MGWGEAHEPVNGGTGTTGQIELANEALDRLGIEKGPLAVRVLALVGRMEKAKADFAKQFMGSAGSIVEADPTQVLYNSPPMLACAHCGGRFPAGNVHHCSSGPRVIDTGAGRG